MALQTVALAKMVPFMMVVEEVKGEKREGIQALKEQESKAGDVLS